MQIAGIIYLLRVQHIVNSGVANTLTVLPLSCAGYEGLDNVRQLLC